MKILVFVFALNLIVANNILFSQQTPQKFVKEVNYLLSLPDGYNNDTITKWPVILFLHGKGERGNDLEKVKTHGPPKLINAGEKMPFIVISPQVPDNQWWNPDLIVLMLKDCVNKYRIDEDRVYLTGLSMGGMGTWAVAMKYPELFAALAPIAGAGNTSEAWGLRHTPVWIFHGEKDPLVAVNNARIMYQALIKYGNVKLTIYPDAGHDSWSRTYTNPDLYTWFLSHKRYKFEEGALLAKPEKFTGTYISGNDDSSVLSDSAYVYLKEGKLFIRITGNRYGEQQILQSKDGFFFFGRTNPAELKFNIGKNDKCDSFIYYSQSFTSNMMLNYRKIK
ncbi:MAG: prolyl oligopeptidase family serine peptidase [Bacteroidia bacterium]|nr:prolyl oligopeptidase family serine peptidase [Bacteroidia bacterium]